MAVKFDMRVVEGYQKLLRVQIPLNNTCVTLHQHSQIRFWNFLCNKSNKLHVRYGQEVITDSKNLHISVVRASSSSFFFKKVFTKVRRLAPMRRTKKSMCKFTRGFYLFWIGTVFSVGVNLMLQLLLSNIGTAKSKSVEATFNLKRKNCSIYLCIYFCLVMLYLHFLFFCCTLNTGIMDRDWTSGWI